MGLVITTRKIVCLTSLEYTMMGNLYALSITHRMMLWVCSHSKIFVVTYLFFLRNTALRQTTCPICALTSTPIPGVHHICLSQLVTYLKVVSTRIGIIWILVRKGNRGAPHQTYWIKTLGMEPRNLCCNKPSGWFRHIASLRPLV